MSLPITIAYFCCVPQLDLSYNHTFDFNSPSSQLEYFKSCSKFKLTNLLYQRIDGYFQVDKSFEDLNNINYIVYTNGKKYYYAFITNKSYRAETVTKIFFEIDVIQTYLFDFHLRESFIDRAHVHRWDRNGYPTAETTEEGLELGEHIEVNRDTIYNYKGKGSYLITSSTPLGKLESSSSIVEGNINSSSVNMNLIYFIKQEEGFSATKYRDSGGVETQGYGLTQEELNGLPNIISEEQATKILIKKINENYFKPLYTQVTKDKLNLNMNQLMALTDLCYNHGVNGTLGGAVYQAIKQGKTGQELKNIWENYCLTDLKGNFQPGLKIRRKAEYNIYSTGATSGYNTAPSIQILGKNINVTANGGYGYRG